jgi:hypothetical protein
MDDLAIDDRTLVSIKVRTGLHRWLKIIAAERGLKLYEVVEELVTESRAGARKPWRKGARVS